MARERNIETTAEHGFENGRPLTFAFTPEVVSDQGEKLKRRQQKEEKGIKQKRIRKVGRCVR